AARRAEHRGRRARARARRRRTRALLRVRPRGRRGTLRPLPLAPAAERRGGGGRLPLPPSSRERNGWSAPSPVPGLNTPRSERGPYVAADGFTLYFDAQEDADAGHTREDGVRQ